MLSYSDLTVFKNTDGGAMALGYPIHSLLLQNDKPLFMRGGKKRENKTHEHEEQDYEDLAVPAGLVCMTQTICKSANKMEANDMGANDIGANVYDMGANDIEANGDIVPEGLYERLMALAETKPVTKKMTKKKQPATKKQKKTHKRR
jgi:hypothetical protein